MATPSTPIAGERLRANVDDVPRLPSFPATWVLEDPRRRPYLVFWTAADGDIPWALKMAPTEDPDAVLVTLEGGQTQRLTIVRRPMPQGPGTAFFYHCPTCRKPRRYLYRLSLSLTGLVDYFGLQCQRCAGLRFRSGTVIAVPAARARSLARSVRTGRTRRRLASKPAARSGSRPPRSRK